MCVYLWVFKLVSYCASVLAIAWPADFLFQPTGPAAKLPSLESFWLLLLLRVINLTLGIYGCFRSTEGSCECVCTCMHADWDLWPRAVPGSNASAFFFFLEKRRLKISLAFFPLFLLCSFLALRLLQIRQCVKNLAGCVRVSPDVWDCISGLGLVGFLF